MTTTDFSQLNIKCHQSIPEIDLAPDTNQINTFGQTGVGIVRNLIGHDEVQKILTTYMSATQNGPIEGVSEIRDVVQAGDVENDPLVRYPRMLMQHRHRDMEIGELAFRYMLDKRIEKILQCLIQEQPLAAQSMFYFKAPGSRGQALHQDNNPLAVEPGTCVAVWIALDKVDAENGALMVVPGSGPMDLLCDIEREDRPDLFFNTGSIKLPKGIEPIAAEMNPGDALIFNGQLIHGSYPNTSKERWRRVLIFHYVPASCKQVAGFYHPLLDFESNEVEKNISPTGGLCGQWRENETHQAP